MSLSFLFVALLMTPPEVAAPERTSLKLLLSRDLRAGMRTESCQGGSVLFSLFRARDSHSSTELAHIDLGNLFFARSQVSTSRQLSAWKSAVDLACGLALGKSAGVVVGPTDLAFGGAALRTLAEVAQVPLFAANVRLGRAASGEVPFVAGRFLEASDNAARVAMVAGLWLAPNSPESEAFHREGFEVVPMVPALAEASAAFRGRGARSVIGLVRKGAGTAPLPIEALEPWLDALVVTDDGPEGFWTWSSGEKPRIEPVSGGIPTAGGGESARAALQVAACAQNVPVPPALRDANVGVATCAQCHAAAYRHWQKGPHARAMQALLARRQGANLDCRSCHQTPAAAAARRPGLPFSGVECESCHGPGERHVKAPTGGTYAAQASDMRRRCEGCHMEDRHQGKFRYPEDRSRVLGRGHGRPSDRP